MFNNKQDLSNIAQKIKNKKHTTAGQTPISTLEIEQAVLMLIEENEILSRKVSKLETQLRRPSRPA